MFERFEKKLIKVLEWITVTGLALLVLAMGALFIYHLIFRLIWKI